MIDKAKLEILGLSSLIFISVGVLSYFAYRLHEYNKDMQEKMELNEKEAKIKQQKYSVLYEKIFGPGGFADTNFNKEVDIYERASAYKKLGLKDFPEKGLSLEQLEELVEQYMGDI